MSATGRKRVLAIVLAGGEGKRLMPLTADRAKPAVPFAGIYRLIDFALSNVVNSGYLRVVVLTQYKSHSLDRHVTTTWRMSTLLGNYVAPVPAQQRVGKHWYLGSADAIYQSLNLIHDDRPDIVVVVGADHVYRMDFAQMVDQHVAERRRRARWRRSGSRSRWPTSSASSTSSPEDPRSIREFLEKPTDPAGLPGQPGGGAREHGQLRVRRPGAGRGGHPRLGHAGLEARHGRRHRARRSSADSEAGVYDFKDNQVPGATDRDRGYWRDVGTMRSFYDAHMDVVSPLPVFNLYNGAWPIFTDYGPQPPAKLAKGADGIGAGRRGGAALARGRRVGRAGTPVGAVARPSASSRARSSRTRS